MDIFKKVEENYKHNFKMLGDKKFHFASRLLLWSGDDFAKNKLLELRSEYIGTSEREYAEKIKHTLQEELPGKKILFEGEREKFFMKYPLLKKYNAVLFKNLFCETVYGIDLRETISRYVKREEFVALRCALLADREAIAVLSTHAINYLYILGYYLREKKTFFDTQLFIDIVENEIAFKDEKASILRVYLLTHCIIGESAFYARSIERNKKDYDKMLLIVEKIVSDNYASISLDNKLEFLVCAKLCKKNSYLEKKILSETENSYDFEGKYFTKKGKIQNKDSFRRGEHRNVLALMAFYFEKR